jgi:lysophospholipase L1-like esterase
MRVPGSVVILLAALAASCATTPREARPEPRAALSTVHFLGRVDRRVPDRPRFAWPGSAIAATFDGTGVDLTLEDSGTNYFSVVVDGGAPSTLATRTGLATYPLAAGLAPGRHTLVVTKRTEANVGHVAYVALTPRGGALVASPEPFARRIEYVGDSTTCGYGDLGADATCHFSPETEDETQAYGALAAAELGAQQTAIAYSGIGVLRDYHGATANQMPVRFELALPDDPASAWTFDAPAPDVVVVNLGSNDFATGDPGEPFEAAYVALLRRIRGHYPRASILCVAPLLDDPAKRDRARGYVDRAVAAAAASGDRRVQALAFEPRGPGEGLGCDYHASLVTHRRLAATLARVIRTLQGW